MGRILDDNDSAGDERFYYGYNGPGVRDLLKISTLTKTRTGLVIPPPEIKTISRMKKCTDDGILFSCDFRNGMKYELGVSTAESNQGFAASINILELVVIDYPDRDSFTNLDLNDPEYIFFHTLENNVRVLDHRVRLERHSDSEAEVELQSFMISYATFTDYQ